MASSEAEVIAELRERMSRLEVELQNVVRFVKCTIGEPAAVGVPQSGSGPGPRVGRPEIVR